MRVLSVDRSKDFAEWCAPWGTKDAAHGASDNELVIRRGLEPREPFRAPLNITALCYLPAPRSIDSDPFRSNCTTERPGIRQKSRRLTVNTE